MQYPASVLSDIDRDCGWLGASKRPRLPRAPGKAPAKESRPPPTQSTASRKATIRHAEPQDPLPRSRRRAAARRAQAGNDSAALVEESGSYLVKYPDSPRRGAIYRALLESEMQLHESKVALDYAEKVIAIQPEDSQTMYLAVTILEKMPDEASQIRAIDYDTRLIDRVAKADPESRPQQMTLDDWQAGRNKFLVELYVLRGRMQQHLHKNDDAVKDLTAGFRLLPTRKPR